MNTKLSIKAKIYLFSGKKFGFTLLNSWMKKILTNLRELRKFKNCSGGYKVIINIFAQLCNALGGGYILRSGLTTNKSNWFILKGKTEICQY